MDLSETTLLNVDDFNEIQQFSPISIRTLLMDKCFEACMDPLEENPGIADAILFDVLQRMNNLER